MKIVLTVFIIFSCALMNAQTFTNDSTIFTIVEVPAEYPGGMASLARYFQKNISACNEPQYMACSSYFFKFVIDKNGTAKEPTVSSNCGVCDAMKESFSKAILQMEKWKPAMMNNKPVASYMQMPIKLCYMR